jgi:3-deoxy-D-manno-octulosonic acid kinase
VAGFGSFVEKRTAGRVDWVRTDLGELDLDVLWGALAPMPGAKGRGGVGLLELSGHAVVVRPYRRGGLFGGLLGDRYLDPGRARDELEVLAALAARGVPVVEPVAATARRSGLFWRLRICTRRLEGACPVPEFLRRHEAHRRAAATAVGHVVRAAFEAGLLHPDLHLDNVLCRLDGAAVHAALVDLDRARLVAGLDDVARVRMLARMQRYCLKHAATLAATPSSAEAMRVLAAVEPDRARRRRLWRAVQARVDGGRGRRRQG